MKTGTGSHHTMDDQKFETSLKKYSYRYPVAFREFWKGVRDKLTDDSRTQFQIPRLFWAASGIAAAMVLIFSAALLYNIRPSAMVIMTRGHGEVRIAGSKNWRPVSLRDRLTAGMEFRTSGSDSLELQINDNFRVRLNEDSEVVLQDIGPLFRNEPNVVKLEQGSIEVQTRFTKPDSRFIVIASRIRISSGNNRISVSRNSDGETSIDAMDAPVVLEPAIKKDAGNLDGVRVSAGRQARISDRDLDEILGPGNVNRSVTTGMQEKYAAAVRVSPLKTVDTAALSSWKSWITDPNALIKTSFISEPANARIVLNGRNIGNTPLSCLQERGKTISLVMARKGFSLFATNVRPTNDTVYSFSLDMEKESPDLYSGLSPFPERLEWFENVPSGVWEKPCTVSEGTIYCADGNTIKTYYNRKLVKSTAVTREKISLTRPLYRNGRIYAASDTGSLYSYSPSTEEVAVIKAGGSLQTFHQPVAAGEWIILVSEGKGVELYNLDGKPESVILYEETRDMRGEPVYAQKAGYLVLATADGSLVAYDLRNRKTVWKTADSSQTDNYRPVCANNNSVFVFSRQTGNMYSYRLSDGKFQWKKKIPETSGSAVQLAADDERVFITGVAEASSRFIVLNAAYGNAEFQQAFPGELLAPMLMEGKTVLVSKSGRTALYEPAIQELEYNSILK